MRRLHTTHRPRTERKDALWRAVFAQPERTAEFYALTCGITLSTAHHYLAELERERQIVSRRESHDEAHERYAGEVHSTLTRRLVRRKLRYGVVEMRGAA